MDLTPAPTNLKANTIDGVINSLDCIVAWSIHNQQRTGYFAALYRKVTIQVRESIESGYFDNGPRMERLDVIFANRYLEAFEQFFSGRPTTEAWDIAFHFGNKNSPIVLQHLMLGMNAHINLDLGIAAAQTVPKEELPALKPDFDKINEVLSKLINEVQDELSTIWPMFKWLDWAAGNADESLAKFSMDFARDRAWQSALEYAEAENKQVEILNQDSKISLLGRVFTHPGILLRVVLLIIRLGERGNVAKKIQILT